MSKISFVDKEEFFDLKPIQVRKGLSKVSVKYEDNDFSKTKKNKIPSKEPQQV